MKSNKMKVIKCAIALTGTLVFLSGCGSSVSKNASYDMTGVSEQYSTEYATDNMYMDANTTTEATADYGYEESSGTNQNQVTENAASEQKENRKLIKTVTLDLETMDFDNLLPNISQRVNELGGYIEYSDTYNGSAYYGTTSNRNATITVRIPVDSLDDFINQVEEQSNITSKSESVEDVTLQYVDLQSHKESLETEQKRLLEIMKTAETVEDIITIESRLSEVRYQLESMESQLRTYDNQIDYSTVTIYVSEVQNLTPAPEEGRLSRMGIGFISSLKAVGNGILDFCMNFVIAIPYLIIVALIIIAVIFIIRKIRINRRNKKNKINTIKKEDKNDAGK